MACRPHSGRHRPLFWNAAHLKKGAGSLLCMRATSLPLRLRHADLWNAVSQHWRMRPGTAPMHVGSWQFCDFAEVIQVGLLKAPAGAALRKKSGGRLVEDRRGRPSRPYVSGVARISRRALTELLRYWGLPNLQVINREAHVARCSTEARDRRAAPPSASGLA